MLFMVYICNPRGGCYGLQSYSLFFPIFQESPMPDPSDLFANVYVKGLGAEVLISSLFITHYMNLKYKQINEELQI